MTNVDFQKGLTKHDIIQGLKIIGLSQGMFVEVHGSLSSFGYVEGGANTIIYSLMDVVGKEGAIVMSTFPLSIPQELSEIDIKRGLTYKIKVFSPDSDEKSGMGIISDTFRKMPDVLTGTGRHRVSAWGKDKDKNCQGFSNLIENDGRALLLGVDIYRLTSMHYVESKIPEEVRNILEPSDEILKYYPADQWYIETGNPPIKAWYKIQDEAYKKGYIIDHKIGNSKCMFFKIRNVIGLYEEAIDKDPLGLYGLK